MGPVLSHHARTDRTRDTRAAEPRLPAPEDRQPGEGRRLTPDAPHRAYKPRGQCWAPPPHTCAHSTWTAGPSSPQEEGSRRRESARPRTPLATRVTTDGGGRAPNAHTHTRTPAGGTSVRAPQPRPLPPPQQVHQPREIRTPSPALRHSDTTMAEPAAPRKTHPRSPTLDAAHEVIRALGLRGGEGDPPQEDAGADSDLE